jgi:hypothetical protein
MFFMGVVANVIIALIIGRIDVVYIVGNVVGPILGMTALITKSPFTSFFLLLLWQPWARS